MKRKRDDSDEHGAQKAASEEELVAEELPAKVNRNPMDAAKVGAFVVARNDGDWWPARVQQINSDSSLVVVCPSRDDQDDENNDEQDGTWDWTVNENEGDIVVCPCGGHSDTTQGPFMRMYRKSMTRCCVEHVEGIWNLAHEYDDDLDDDLPYDDDLLLAAAKGQHDTECILEWLLRTHHLNFRHTSRQGQSLLHVAAMHGNLAKAFVKLLKVLGANCIFGNTAFAALLKQRDSWGRTVLHSLVDGDPDDAREFFQSFWAETKGRRDCDERAQMKGTRNCYDCVFWDYDIIEMLRKMGAVAHNDTPNWHNWPDNKGTC